MEKLLITVKPRRFVYHISTREHRQSIHRLGLRTNSNNGILDFKEAIFANNAPPSIEWFPIIMDIWEWDFTYANYDIWRIDTHKINRQWFVDYRCLGSDQNVHILTHLAIPRFALDLFVVGDLKTVFTELDGVSHCHILGGFIENKLKRIKF